MTDRRIARSRFTDEALRAWLDAVARRTGTEAIVVADTAGLLIGGGIGGDVAEEMAAFAARATLRPGATAVDEVNGKPLTVRRFDWEGEPIYIAALGPSEHARVGLDEAISGVDRILTEGSRPTE